MSNFHMSHVPMKSATSLFFKLWIVVLVRRQRTEHWALDAVCVFREMYVFCCIWSNQFLTQVPSTNLRRKKKLKRLKALKLEVKKKKEAHRRMLPKKIQSPLQIQLQRLHQQINLSSISLTFFASDFEIGE